MSAFRSSTYHLGRFNSAVSSDVLDIYNDAVINSIVEDSKKISTRTFAPSSFRCDRLCWLRLRGTEPDALSSPDPVLQFKADLGTSCHLIIQKHLSEALGDDWIDVESYLKQLKPHWKYKIQRNGFECFVEIEDPAFRFACDGIIRRNNELYLVEIKTVEYSAFADIVNPLDHHKDQVKCYATLLDLSGVLFIYQERSYGDIKCYEYTVTSADRAYVINKVNRIQQMSVKDIAPPRLPPGDTMCTHCKYRKKCREWG